MNGSPQETGGKVPGPDTLVSVATISDLAMTPAPQKESLVFW